jgi:superfamily II RNA helicase
MHMHPASDSIIEIAMHVLQVKNSAKSIFEGSLVRALRRLHGLLLELKGACQVIGDHDLSQRFEDAAGKLNRDVVFAASLYL